MNPKISILITAWKEEKSIGRCIETFIGSYKGDLEILLAIPDKETIEAAITKAKELNIEDKIRVSDLAKDGKPKGKPKELNYLMDMAKGDIWFLGDGDVFYKDGNIEKMLKHFEDPNVFAVTGRPLSADSKNSRMGYFGHLLADAAHHKRMVDLTDHPVGKGMKFVKKRSFFPVSGYLFAMRKTDIRSPEDTLVEDAYFSYAIFNSGRKIEYEPEAEVYVKYPTNLKDYFKQKKRSAGGYVQLYKYGVVKKETKTRSFWRELEYFWFPIKYAKSLKQFFWSLTLYPIRLWQWILIHWEQKIKKKSFLETWVRVESTK
jgi:biofilm PGA synthesis N-glycosyltransferase PgaC